MIGNASASELIVRSDNDETTTYSRSRVAGVLDVELHVWSPLGDTLPSVTIARPDTGKKISFFLTSPEAVAIHRSGAWVWRQISELRFEVHDLRSGATTDDDQPAAPTGRPSRGDVMLVSEVIGPRCPYVCGPEGKFVFADDEKA